MMVVKENHRGAEPGSGRMIPPKRSTQWAQSSEHVPWLGFSRAVAGVDEEGPRCSARSGQAHSNPQGHPVPINDATDSIEGMKAEVVKRGDDAAEESYLRGPRAEEGSLVLS